MSQSSFLSLDRDQKLQITIDDLIGQSINVIGLKRSGKSYTGGVLLEEWLDHALPVTVIDPQGEWWGLKQGYPVVVAGRGQRADCPLTLEGAADLATFSFEKRIPVILSLVGIPLDERFEILAAYLQRLWDLAEEAYERGNPQPYAIFLEEARMYAPEGKTTPVKPVLQNFVLGGGKYGLTTFLLNQRSANVDKNIFTQASIYFLHRVMMNVDKAIYKEVLPIPEQQVDKLVGQLGRGDAIVLYSSQNSSSIGGDVEIVHMRQRKTFHAGSTPTLTAAPPPLQPLDASLLEALRNLLANSPKTFSRQAQTVDQLQKQVRLLEEELARKNDELKEKQKQIELLSKLTVLLPSGSSLENPSSRGVFPASDELVVQQAVVQNLHLPASPLQVVEGSAARQELGVASDSVSVASLGTLGLDAHLEKKLANLKAWMAKQNHTHRRMLSYLFYQREMDLRNGGSARLRSIQEIAFSLGIREYVLKNGPPTAMVSQRMLSRSRRQDGYYYVSTFSAYLKEEFPNADPLVLAAGIFGEE